MTDFIGLALQYGGFTSLDQVYLSRVLEGLTDGQKLAFITPPPSVINAYFAELYQKKSPEAATDYLLDLTRALDLWQAEPSFAEEKPFVRLNLSGKAYGFCYEKEGLGRVFAQQEEPVTADLLWEIAQVFPHYLVYEDQGAIKLEAVGTQVQVLDRQSLTELTDLEQLSDGSKRLIGYNQEEVAQLAENYAGRKCYRSQNRSAMIYIK